MDFILVSALTLINLLLWLAFIVRFKKLFSVDDIMTNFREGMNNLLKEAERDTALNMNVLDEKIRESKAIVAEAERRIAVLRHDLESAQKSYSFGAQVNVQKALISQGKKARGKAAAKSPARASAKSQGRGGKVEAAYKRNELPGEDEAFALTGLFQENAQKSLFDSPQITVTEDGDAYGKIPVISADVVVSDNPIQPKKPFARRVRELSALGKTVEEIASETDHSTTEVQLVLDTSL